MDLSALKTLIGNSRNGASLQIVASDGGTVDADGVTVERADRAFVFTNGAIGTIDGSFIGASTRIGVDRSDRDPVKSGSPLVGGKGSAGSGVYR